MEYKKTYKNDENHDFKYVRLMIPLDLHRKIVKYQAMKILHEGEKKTLTACMLELLGEATEDID